MLFLQKKNPGDFILITLFLVFFSQAISAVWQTFARAEFYNNGIAFLLITLVYGLYSYKQKYIQPTGEHFKPVIGLFITLLIYTINDVVFKFSIVPAVLLVIGIYCLLGLYLQKQFWERSLSIFLLLVLTLPLFERVQKFVGFPFRIFTADVVSFVLNRTGIGNLSQSAVISTENHATSIDIPCSGVASLYTGSLFMLATYFLQNVRRSARLIMISALFFITLLFFNTWRVFSLIYIYDVLDMRALGNAIHVFLGLFGFIASCSMLWYLVNKYADTAKHKSTIKPTYHRARGKLIAVGLLILFLSLRLALNLNPDTAKINKIPHPRNFALQTIPVRELPFSRGEASYFVNREVLFSRKLSGSTKRGIPFSLIVVVSDSARTHHDPEVCLQGIGHRIVGREIFEVNGVRLRRLTLDDAGASALYWFVGREKNLLDYSERIFQEIKNPKESWVLVTIGFAQKTDMTDPDVQKLIHEVDAAARALLFP